MSTLKVDTIQGKTTANTVQMPSGSVIQVVSTTTDTQTTMTSANFTEYTALTTSITPKFSSSKIFVSLNIYVGNGHDDNYNQYRLNRNGTNIGLGASVGSASQATFSNNGPHTHAIYEIHSVSYSILDNPSTTSQVTYKLFARGYADDSRTIYFNRPHNTGDGQRSSTTSTMTLMEIAQ
tara:strand:- start:217 stop:753 length:537 start_codon:yes stop_codon:yes gene_type:complete